MSVMSEIQRRTVAAHKRYWPGSEKAVLWGLTLLIGILSVAPLARLVWAAVAPQGIPDFSRLSHLLGTRRVLTATLNTLTIAVVSTLLAMLLGTVAALLIALTNLRGKQAWVFTFILPLMIPPQVTALAWVQALSPSSPVLQFFGLSLPPGSPSPLYSMSGILLLLGLHNAPLVFLMVRAGLRRLPADLVEAARAGGAQPWRVLFTIILPLVRPAIFAGAALSFVTAAGNFGIQAMLGIPGRVPTLITLVYQQLNTLGASALADMAVLSLLIATITLGGLMISRWLGGRQDVRVTGTPRSLHHSLGRWRLLVEIIVWLWMILTLLLPLSALLTTSLTQGFGQALTFSSLTLTNYANALFGYPAIRQAFFTSLGLTLLTAVILTVASLFLAYFLSWQRTRLVRVLQLSTELAYALPGIVTGIAAILFFLKPLPLIHVSLYGTVWIILAAYLSNFMALVLRPTMAGFAQIERSLDEAAQIFGAGFLRRMRDILMPLAAPSAMAGTILVVLTALNEIQVSVLLVTSGTQTLGPMIVFLDEGGSSTLAAATGCLMIGVVLMLMLLASVFARRLPEGVLPWRV
ncbi:iron(III) transport system permease protein [Rahnella sp. BIGb0603]|uniref:ABC transporter permease n=1 Tax=Rahnella sp. BIGb0603 TaxID=2940612 RepID=UPI00216732BB|nr:iron ABC transporter permease [Rahnella sp. BIGb0603]MCS3422692.1 iron(III) transport system permease protein [Rahnella sp. BIGb0603]